MRLILPNYLRVGAQGLFTDPPLHCMLCRDDTGKRAGIEVYPGCVDRVHIGRDVYPPWYTRVYIRRQALFPAWSPVHREAGSLPSMVLRVCIAQVGVPQGVYSPGWCTSGCISLPMYLRVYKLPYVPQGVYTSVGVPLG